MTAMFTQSIQQTTCPYCGVGCGVDATVTNGKLTAVTGHQGHPANRGKLCVKGSNLHETVGEYGRLLQPMVGGQPTHWDEATQLIANRFNTIIDEHGPDAVAFYVSGQILTEDYYVANKLMKGFIGSANIDTNSRLCMASAVAGYKRAFGTDTVPCSYRDIEHTDLLVLVGSNAAWTHPILYQRMEQAKEANPDMKVVFIDPRKTATAQLSDLHLPISPGSDVALFNGLLHYLHLHDGLNQSYIEQYTEGFATTLATVETYDLNKVSQITGIANDDLCLFYQAFLNSEAPLTFYSQGVNQSSQGTDKCNAIINCHLATGHIGKLGTGPFSITGQPNAMGGREVGGLANTLAGHLNIEQPEHRELVQTFWDSPHIPSHQGAKAVDMFDLIKQSKIKAVWIMATNPMVSLPNRAEIAAALEQCEFVVVSDCVTKNDTLAYADVCLPATTWAEKNGTVTNSERCISRQRGVLAAPGEARHDWQALCDVAKAMGFHTGFNYTHPYEIFIEHAALSGFRNASDSECSAPIIRDFDISGLNNLDEQGYDELRPIQWPVNTQYPQGCEQMFADNVFFTPSTRAQFVPVMAKAPKQVTSDQYPYVLNSGRLRDQWHTMTRTGRSVALAQHTQAPFIALHPVDAERHDIQANSLIQLTSPFGQVIARADITTDQRRGEVFMPIHWNANNASHGNVSACFSSHADPISGQPESKHSIVNITKVQPQQQASIFCRDELLNPSDYWTATISEHGYQYDMAWVNTQCDPLSFSQMHAPCDTQWHTFTSTAEQTTVVGIKQGQIMWIGQFSQTYPDVIAPWLNDLMAQDDLSPVQLSELLANKIPQQWLTGKTICSCFQVGKNTIIDAIKTSGLNSVSALGEALQCGTNCGSCKSELATLVNEHAPNLPSTSRFTHSVIPSVTL